MAVNIVRRTTPTTSADSNCRTASTSRPMQARNRRRIGSESEKGTTRVLISISMTPLSGTASPRRTRRERFRLSYNLALCAGRRVRRPAWTLRSSWRYSSAVRFKYFRWATQSPCALSAKEGRSVVTMMVRLLLADGENTHETGCNAFHAPCAAPALGSTAQQSR